MRYCVSCMDEFFAWSDERCCWKCAPVSKRVSTPKVNPNLILSDGGRKEAGFNETNDCTVRALANATGRTYEECHMWLRMRGRKPRQGCYFEGILRKANWKAVGHTLTPVPYLKRARGLRTFLERNPQLRRGTYILHSTHHASVLKDGVLIDSFDSSRKEFDAAWHVTKGTV